MESDQPISVLNAKGKVSINDSQSSKHKKAEAWKHIPKSRNESPLSPTDEVAELTSLNSKLSRYIDRVRSLQGENAKLTKYVCSVEQSQLKESEQMHLMYKEKIETLKKEKEKISRQVSHFGATYENILKENKKLKENLCNVDKDLKSRNEKQLALEKDKIAFSEDSIKSVQEVKSLKENLEKMKKDQILFEDQLEKIAKKTEKLSQECQSLSERLKMSSGLIKQKLIDFKTTNHTVDANQNTGYPIKNLVSSFQETIGEGKDCGVSSLISKLHTDLFEQVEQVKFQEFKLKESRSKLESLELKIKNLLDEQEITKQKLKSMENLQETSKLNHQEKILHKEKEIELILEKTQKQMKEFEHLLEEKQGLDAEIAVFKKLVETEEERLGLTKDDAKVFKKSGPDFTFVEEKERATRRELIWTD